jgi:hypothetical protein
MKIIRLLGVVLFGTVVSSGSVGRSVAMPVAKDVGAAANDSVIDVRAARGGGGRGGGAARAGGGRAHVARASGSAGRGNVNTRRNTNVNKRTNVNVNKRTNVNVVGRRPVRGWVARPYYGTIIGGVALGTMIAVSAAGTVPVAPAENMCWFWADSAQVNGYWDYCVAP